MPRPVWARQRSTRRYKRLPPLTPGIRVVPYRMRLTPGNAAELIGSHDLVVDGSDNFATRYLLNDACHFTQQAVGHGPPCLRFEGQLFTFRRGDPPTPLLPLRFPRSPRDPDLVPRCDQAGILGGALWRHGLVASHRSDEGDTWGWGTVWPGACCSTTPWAASSV